MLTPQDYFDTLLKVLGGQALVLAGLWVVARLVFEARLKRQGSAFEQRLKQEGATFEHKLKEGLAEFEDKLRKKLTKFSQRHSLYAQKQLEVFSTIYQKLWQVRDTLAQLDTASKFETHMESMPAFEAVFNDAATYFIHNRFFIPDEVAKIIDSLLNQIRERVAKFHYGHQIEHKGQMYVDHVMDLQKAFEETEALTKTLRMDFQRILSAADE